MMTARPVEEVRAMAAMVLSPRPKLIVSGIAATVRYQHDHTLSVALGMAEILLV
jgi:hypothetical protein